MNTVPVWIHIRRCDVAWGLFLVAAFTHLPSSASAEANDSPKVVEGATIDLYGDPIPYSAKVRLGSERFRTIPHGWDNSVAFTKDGQTLLSLTGNRMSWWDALTGKIQSVKTLDFTTSGFAVAPDSSTFAFAYFGFVEEEAKYKSGVQIRDLTTGDLVGQIALEGHQNDTNLVFTPDGRSLIHAGAQGRIRVFDVSLQEELLDYQLPATERRRIDCLAVSPNGRQITAACARKLFIWNWLEGEEPDVLEGYDRLYTVGYTPNGKSLVLCQNQYGKRREEVQILNLEKREVTHRFKDPVMDRFRIRNILFAEGGSLMIVPNGDYVGTTKDNAILVWLLSTGELVHRFQSRSRPGMVAMSPDGQLVATAGQSELSVWNLRTGQRMAEDLASHAATISGVRFTSDGKRLVTASDDETTRVWDSYTGKQIGTIWSDHWVRGLTVSPDNKWIVTSSLDDTVCLWDASNLKLVYRLAGHGTNGGHRSVAFVPDSSRFASFGDDGYLRLWDVSTGKLLLEEQLKPGGQPFGDDQRSPFHEFAKGVFSADASKLLVMKGEASYLYDAPTGRELKKVSTAKPIESACLSADGRHLLYARPTEAPKRTPLQDGRVRFSGPRKFEAVFMDTEDAKEKWAFEIHGLFGSIGLSPDGRFAAICQRSEPADVIYIVDATNGRELAKIDGVEKVCWDSADCKLAFSPDSGRIAVALENTTVVIWDLKEMGVWKEQ